MIRPVDPAIRYTHSSDGTRIAYAVMGSGPTMLYAPIPSLCHLQRALEDPGTRAHFERLSARRTLIRMDFRGTGLAQRDGFSDRSSAAMASDMRAVLEATAEGPTDILASGMRSSHAIWLAAHAPGHVRRLILSEPIFTPPGSATPGVPGFRQLIETNYQLFLEMLVQRMSGKTLDEAGPIVDLMRAGIEQHESLAQVLAFDGDADWQLAAQVTCPVAVVTRADAVPVPGRTPADFAAAFPHGELRVLPTGSRVAPFGDPRAVEELIDEFFGPGSASAVTAATLSPREREILRLIANGSTNDEIASRLDLSVRTVERHITGVYGKIGARGRADATAWAIRNGLA